MKPKSDISDKEIQLLQINSVHLHYKDRPVNAVQDGGDHTKTHQHTVRTSAITDGTYSCNWDSQIQLFLRYHQAASVV